MHPASGDVDADGKFPFDDLITYYPFDQINQTAADSLAGKVVKPVVCFA